MNVIGRIFPKSNLLERVPKIIGQLETMRNPCGMGIFSCIFLTQNLPFEIHADYPAVALFSTVKVSSFPKMLF